MCDSVGVDLSRYGSDMIPFATLCMTTSRTKIADVSKSFGRIPTATVEISLAGKGGLPGFTDLQILLVNFKQGKFTRLSNPTSDMITVFKGACSFSRAAHIWHYEFKSKNEHDIVYLTCHNCI